MSADQKTTGPTQDFSAALTSRQAFRYIDVGSAACQLFHGNLITDTPERPIPAEQQKLGFLPLEQLLDMNTPAVTNYVSAAFAAAIQQIRNEQKAGQRRIYALIGAGAAVAVLGQAIPAVALPAAGFALVWGAVLNTNLQRWRATDRLDGIFQRSGVKAAYEDLNSVANGLAKTACDHPSPSTDKYLTEIKNLRKNFGDRIVLKFP